VRHVLRLGFIAAIALAVLVPCASATHDPEGWFAGRWLMVFPDEPTQGPLELELASEPEMRKQMASEGFRYGSWLRGNCTDNAKTQYYTGEATRGADTGPIVACTNSRSGLVYAVFKSMYKVEVGISWPRGSSALASSFNLPNGSVDHWNIFFKRHFAADGTQTEDYVVGLHIVPAAGDTGAGEPSLIVRWAFQVRGTGASLVLGGAGRVAGKGAGKLQTVDLGSLNNVITWKTARGETLLDVTGGSYQARTTTGGRATRTLILKVTVITSAVSGCKKGTTGTVTLNWTKAASQDPDLKVARNLCGQEFWASKP
jgi:hypothetical protein